MKKTALIAVIVVLLALLIGCAETGRSRRSERVKKADRDDGEGYSDPSGGSVEIDNRTTEPFTPDEHGQEQDAPVTPDDFETKGYLYENSLGGSIYFLAVKNNSGKAVEIDVNGVAKDADGKMIGADDASITILGPGEESVCYFYFDDVSGIDTVDYTLEYSTSTWYYPVLSNLKIEKTLNDQNVTLLVTNNGQFCADYVEAYALFLDENDRVVNYDSAYLADDNSEIKPGRTIAAQLNNYYAYDHVVVFLTGRSNGDTADLSQYVSPDDFAVEEYSYENSLGNTLYFLAITNNSEQAVSVWANGIAKDANGNATGADELDITILGPGEQSIGYFYFDSVSEVASVEYEVTYSKETYYDPVLSDLEIEQSVSNRKVVVSVTNNGEYAAEFVQAYALFFDSNGKVVGYDYTYISDDDYEIKPGKTVVDELNNYSEFDSVKLFFTGRHS